MTPEQNVGWGKCTQSTVPLYHAPAYPSLEVEALREDPSPIEALTMPAIVEHYERVLDDRYGAAGVAIVMPRNYS